MSREPEVSTMLPAPVRNDLVLASKITDEKERQRRIDEIVRRAKGKYPQLFKHN